ncbi:MAG: hypothetical protein RLZZ387_3853 [Chloroflexota bacterium]|jgi:hypothetical protein
MGDNRLLRAVERFTEVMAGADEERLARSWAWGTYSEGTRFAFFRTCEELRELTVRVASVRRAQQREMNGAQHILAQYHAAYRDLQAALLGLSDEDVTRAPAEGEWPVSVAVGHMVGADAGFLVVCAYALEQHRAGAHEPGEPPEAFWITTLGDESGFEAVMGGPFSDLLAYHDLLHERVLGALGGITDSELELPSRYWEGEPLPLRFRLHRFESHLRQHTVQVDKTLAAISRGPSEALRLTRLVYAALAEAEGASLGAEDVLEDERACVAAGIEARADELAEVVR